MNKYIVKNCPAYISNGDCAVVLDSDDPINNFCQDIDDCPIKQVVELVEAENKVHRKIQRPIPSLNKRILQTLQVEEVE